MILEFSQLPSRLKTLPAEVELVSFDIFDTLLERHIEPPDAVKVVAARGAAARVATTGTPLTPETLLAARCEAEAKLRLRAQEAGLDSECAFSDIAEMVARRLAPGEEEVLINAMVESELEAEKEALFLRPQVAELLATLRAQGKRIVAVSDMYLDGTLILRLFSHFGLNHLVDHIYVSADHKLGKYSGRLFRHVLASENIAASRMVHVGDNPHSDFAAPRDLGIRAIYLRDGASLRRRQVGRTLQWLGEFNPFWRGEHLLGMLQTATRGNFYYRYGHDQLGPIYCGFVLGVMEEIRRRGIEKVFFLAREGDMFRLLYERLSVNLAESMPSPGYLYVSRKSVFLPAAWRGLLRRHLDVALSNPRQKGLYSVAQTLGISPADFAAVARRFELKEVDQPIRGWSDARFTALLADAEFQKIIIRHAQPARCLLRRYLEGEGFFGRQRVALVDIGWNGTIQHALRETFGTDNDYPETIGLYLSFNANFDYEFAPDEAKGILYDGRSSPARHNVFALFEELFENAARAHHGTTVGYRDNKDIVAPVLRSEDSPDRQAEREFEAHATALRLGALDFATAFAKAVRLTGYSLEDIRPALLRRVERCVVHPTPVETSHLLKIIHAEDFGSDNVMRFDEYRLPGPSILLHPKRLLRLLRSSNWKYGTARTLGLTGFNHALRQVELTMARRKKKTPVAPHPRLAERLLLALVRLGTFPALNRLRKLLLLKRP